MNVTIFLSINRLWLMNSEREHLVKFQRLDSKTICQKNELERNAYYPSVFSSSIPDYSNDINDQR